MIFFLRDKLPRAPLPASGARFSGSDHVSRLQPLHGKESDCLYRRQRVRFEGPPAFFLLLLRNASRNRWRASGPGRRLHIGPSVLGAGDSSSGFERDSYIRHDFLVVDVGGGVLPLETIPHCIR